MDLPKLPMSMRSPLLPGLVLSGLIAVIAMGLAESSAAKLIGVSTLTVAIVLGIVIGNSPLSRFDAAFVPGADFARTRLLRAGIVLYGFRVSFQEITAVGWSGVVLAGTIVTATFLLAVWLGTRVFRLDTETSMLIGAGSAVCGAAAVLATAPVVRGSAEKVTIAVSTVVVFGTLSMFLYPMLYPYLSLSDHAFGMYVGSTMHEVAQVMVAAGVAGEEALSVAVVQKMLRVMMLVPFLFILSRHVSIRGDDQGGLPCMGHVPWFAVLFVVVIGINSLNIIPLAMLALIHHLDLMLLATAMAALGAQTKAVAVRRAGFRPSLLALALFGFLGLGGYMLNMFLQAWAGA